MFCAWHRKSVKIKFLEMRFYNVKNNLPANVNRKLNSIAYIQTNFELLYVLTVCMCRVDSGTVKTTVKCHVKHATLLFAK